MIYRKNDVEIEYYKLKETINIDGTECEIKYIYIERIESFDKNKGNAKKTLNEFIKQLSNEFTYIKLTCLPTEDFVDMEGLLRFYRDCNFWILEKVNDGYLMINDRMWKCGIGMI